MKSLPYVLAIHPQSPTPSQVTTAICVSFQKYLMFIQGNENKVFFFLFKQSILEICLYQTIICVLFCVCFIKRLTRKQFKKSSDQKYSETQFLIFLSFQGHSCGIQKFPDQGVNWSPSHWPTPQPQQCRIQVASATYTTAHSNARSFNLMSEARD